MALLIKALLDELGLAAYPKTSGSDGMHVLVPISRRHTFESTRRFATVVAGALVRTRPELVTTEFLKERRRGVLVDANQNREGATIASVYSVRPHPGAPVSTPLRWEELTPSLDAPSGAPVEELKKLTDQLLRLNQEGGSSQRTTAAMASLAEGIQGLVKNMRGEQQMLRDWIEAQQEEAKAMRRTLDKLSSRIGGGERITVAGERSSLSAKLGQLDETGGE